MLKPEEQFCKESDTVHEATACCREGGGSGRLFRKTVERSVDVQSDADDDGDRLIRSGGLFAQDAADFFVSINRSFGHLTAMGSPVAAASASAVANAANRGTHDNQGPTRVTPGAGSTTTDT